MKIQHLQWVKRSNLIRYSMEITDQKEEVLQELHSDNKIYLNQRVSPRYKGKYRKIQSKRMTLLQFQVLHVREIFNHIQSISS